MKIELVLEADKEEFQGFVDLLKEVRSDMEQSDKEAEMLDTLTTAIESTIK